MILRDSVRRRRLRRFPYALLYKIKPSKIRILAVMNLKAASYRLGGSRVPPPRRWLVVGVALAVVGVWMVSAGRWLAWKQTRSHDLQLVAA